MNTIRDTETASTFLRGTSKVGELNDVTYSDILRVLGEPTFDERDSDDKVQIEWVVQYKDQIFTVYDWKTYSLDYTLNELTNWSIGGKGDPTQFVDTFYEKLISILNGV